MGCDIHATVEYCEQDAPDKRYWFGLVHNSSLARDYVMFGAMVDGHGRAREGQQAVAPARGAPPKNDSAHDYAWAMAHDEDYPDVGDHTLSWLTPLEFREAIRFAREFRAQTWGESDVDVSYHALAAMLDALAERLGNDNVRVVFGFDN